MVDALSDDDTAKTFKYRIRVHDIKQKAFKFAILLELPTMLGFEYVTSVVVSA